VLLAPDVLAQPPWLRALGQMPIESGAVCCLAEGVAVLEADERPNLLALLSRAQWNGGGVEGDGAETAGMMRLQGPQDIPRAEAWLLRALVKESESFMSRHVERPISLAITRRLVDTRISPNTMTAVSLAFGFLAAPFFLSSAAGLQLAGALLFWLHSVLDGCDGELARLRFQESRWGGFFDFWGDNMVHVAVFLCMAAGWALAVGAAWPVLVGAAAALGTLGSAAFVTRHVMRGTSPGAPLFTSVAPARASRLSRLLDAVGQRDFIYAVIVFSAAGKATWIVALAALGAPIFLLLMLWSAWVDSRRIEGCA
jgi:phosphatidylglycerophosphate synthase